MSELTPLEELALYVGGGLVLLGTVGIGLLEVIAGSPHPVSAEGQIVHEALVPLHVRSYVVLLGLVVWGLYAVYRVVTTTPESTETRRTL